MRSRELRMLAVMAPIVVLLITAATARPVYAQRRGRAPSPSQVPHYTPQSPTVSPYVGLLNKNNGPVTNYFGLVRPLQRQQSFNAAQAQATANQDLQLGNQEQQLSQLKDEQQAFSQPKVTATGTAGWFQNLGTRPPKESSSLTMRIRTVESKRQNNPV